MTAAPSRPSPPAHVRARGRMTIDQATGAVPCRDLRVLGLLTGGDPAQDADWDALVAGRVRAVLDHF